VLASREINRLIKSTRFFLLIWIINTLIKLSGFQPKFTQ
jgi:hypothetical protein